MREGPDREIACISKAKITVFYARPLQSIFIVIITITKSDWLSTALISALIGEYAPSRALLNDFSVSLLAKQNLKFLGF